MTDSVGPGQGETLFPGGMFKQWWTAGELAAAQLPGLPGRKQNVIARAERDGWGYRDRQGRGGGREYAWSALPEATRREISRQFIAQATEPTRVGTLAPGAVPHAALPDGARERALARIDLLTLLDRFRDERGLGQTAAERAFATLYSAGEIEAPDDVRRLVPRVSWNSLARWRRYLQAGQPHRLGGRNPLTCETPRGRIDANPFLLDLIVSRMEAHPHVSTRQVREWLVSRGVPAGALPGERRLRAWMSRYRAENRMRLAMVHDPDGARSRYQPAFGKASAGIERLNQLWELDATPADVMLKDGRHVVVGVIDVLTRRGRVLVVPTSRATAVVAVLRQAMLAWGVPEAVKTDNGKDFVSRHVTGALKALGIRHRLCPPFTPEAKPHIERFLGTLMHDLVETLPGYIGHNVAERQKIRSRESFAARFGKDDADTFQVALTAAEFQHACDTWCASVYERRPHAGLDGQTPHVMGVTYDWQRRVIADEAALDVVLLPPASGDGWRSVGKHGIKIQGGTYVAPELATAIGQRVRVHTDPTDAGRVCVYDAEGKFLCWAVAPEREGIDLAALAARTREIHRGIERATRAEARRRKRDYGTADAWRDLVSGAAPVADAIVPIGEDAGAHEAPALDEGAAARAPRRIEDLTDDELAEAQSRVAAMNGAAEERAQAQLAEEERLRAMAREMVEKAEQRSRGA